MDIGKQIRALRARRGVRQEELAEYLGISAQAVSKWETGASLPDVVLLPRIAVYFGVTIDELFRLPDEDQFERIENAMWREDRMDNQEFLHYCTFLRGCIEDGRNPLRARILLGQLYKHRAYADHEAAKPLLHEALELEPGNHDAWSALIEAYGGACGDEWLDNHFSLIEFCKAFLDRHPETYRALYALVENLIKDDRFEEAVPFIGQLRTLGCKGQSEMYDGDVCLSRGEIASALEHWNCAVEENPCVWQVWCSRADRLKKLDRYEEALNDYARAMEVQSPPRLTDPLHSRAQLFEQLGRPADAIAERRQILEVLCTEYGIEEGICVDDQLREIARLERMT